MRKLLTILTMLVAFASQGWADDPEITVWVGKQAISYSQSYPGIQYNTADTLSTMFSGLATGDVIKIYTSTSYDSGQEYVLTYRAGSGYTWTDLVTTVSDGTISYTVENDDIANYIAERGLIIRGQAFDMDKITITKTGGSLGTSWAGYVSISWNNSYPGVQFDTNGQMNIPDLVAGDIIRITTTAEGEGFQYALNYKADNWDWTDVSSDNVSYSEHVISYMVESDAVATLIKERGLIIKGIYFHIKSIEVSKLQYTLSATAANGSIKIGDTDTDFSSGSYDRNSSITLIAVPTDGYRFVNWTDDNNSNNEISTSANYTFTLTANTALTAHFIQQFTVTATSANTEQGIVAITNADANNKYDAGSTVTITATPTSDSYEFEKWTKIEDAEWSSTDNPLVINSLDGNYTLTATFMNPKILDYTHDYFIAANNFSDIAVGGNIIFTCTVPESQTGQLKIIYPDLEGGKVYTNEPVSLESDGTYTYVIADETICNSIKTYGLWIQGAYATFVSVSYTDPAPAKTSQDLSTGTKRIVTNGGVTISKDKLAGITSGDILTVAVSYPASDASYTLKSAGEGEEYTNWQTLGNVTTVEGSFTYVFTEDDLTNVKASGLFVTGNGYTCGNISIETAATISTAGTHENPSVSFTASATEGTIAVKNGSTTVNSGDKIGAGTSLTITATPATGYEFVKWTSPTLSDEVAVLTETTVTMPDGNLSIAAQFQQVDEGEAEPNASTVNTTEIFSTSTALGNWDVATVTMEASKFTNAQKDDYIKITLTPSSTDSQISLQTMDNSWSNLAGFSTVTTGKTATKYVYKITEDALTQLRATGLAIKGKDCTVTKVELLTNSVDVRTEQTLLAKSVEIDSEGSTYVTIPKEKFENVADGDILKIYGTVSDQSQLALYYMADNWTILSEDANWSSFTTSPYSLTLTETTAGYLKSNGLAIKGKNFTFTKATLTSAGAVPTINYALTKSVSPAEKGSITVMQGETNVSETTSFAEGTTLTLTATAVEGYVFLKWMSGETELEANTDKSLTVTMDADKSITAFFEAAADTRTEQPINMTENVIGNWNNFTIKKEKFNNVASTGDVIKIYVKDVKEDAQISLKIPTGNWDEFKGFNPTTTDTEFSYTITSEVLAQLKEYGLAVSGKNYTSVKLTLKTNGTVPIENYALTYAASPEIGGTVAVTKKVGDASENIASGTTVAEFTELTATVTANEGFSFKNWQVNGQDKTNQSSTTYKFVMDKDASLLAVFNPPIFEYELTLWEDSKAITWDEWSTGNSNENFSQVKKNDMIRITFTKSDDSPQMQIWQKDADWNGTQIYGGDVEEPSYAFFVANDAMATNIMERGLYIKGQNATITKIELLTNSVVTDPRTEKTLVEKTQAIADGDIEINRGLFSNAVAGDIIRIYAKDLSATSKIALATDYDSAFDGANWTGFTESPFSLKLTASLLSKVQEKNLLIRGENFTFKKAVLYTESELGEAIGSGGEEPEISNTDASEEAKKLFNVLKDLYGEKIVSGVVANVDWNTKEAENVYNWTGKWPALNVYDFINLHASKDVNSAGWVDYSDITTAKNWWKEGGIVGAMWHWQVKANNGTDYTCTPGTAADETSFDASKVYVDGTSENTLAKQQLDQLCGYLKKMQDAGIPVVWRPLHEASGNVEQYSGGKAWFWWGAKGADVYKQLWQWMYNYMVKTKGLNNLIWVWTSQTNDNNWYPGDAYVDIIGRDNYGATAATLATEYEALKAAYPNKMITLSECGNSESTEMAKLSSIWDAGSRWSWFMTWYDGTYNDGTSTTHKHAGKTWWDDAMAKDYVVTRDQMKELLGQDSGGGSQTGVNISLDDLNEGWSSTYDTTTKTITTTGDWGARGWYIGDGRYNSKGSITVKFQAVDFPVTLKMVYINTNNEEKAVQAGAAAGETEIVLDIPTDVKTINTVHITYEKAGTLVLTAVSVNDKVPDNRTEKSLVEKTQAIADGDIEINRGLFSNAVVGDIIRIYATGLSATSKIALATDYDSAFDGANWTEFTESPFALKLTASLLSKVQEKNLLIRGGNFTFKKAVLYTESELGNEIIDIKSYTLTIQTPQNGTITVKRGNEQVSGGSYDEGTVLTLTAIPNDDYQFVKWTKNGADAGTESTLTITMDSDVDIAAFFEEIPKPVIDEETGETDLSTLTAQDETTTVTYDEETETVTMTTTEPDKGVQIWFDTPEEVKGNVLLVDITEANVTVSVTVRYTDGTQSSMTSTAAASQRTVARRAASNGTTIAVPVETGKQVQCIEVKNAEAGVIHITKMAVIEKNVFDENGKADLSMGKAQSNATYDTSTYTLATTKGWTGLTITPLETEEVKGIELMVKFASKSQVKVAVTYSDDEGSEIIMDEAAPYVKMTLDGNKNVKDIMIQTTTAAIIQLTEVAVNQTATPDELPEPVFSNGKADLSRFEVQDANKVMYNAETYKMATTDGWIGVQMNTSEAESVSGAELAVSFTEAVKVKLSVTYKDGTQADTISAQAQQETRLLLDATKVIQQIQVQPTEAGALQFVELVVRQTPTPDPEPVYLFNEQGEADLTMFQAMDDNASYDTTTYQITTSQNWAGIQAWLENPQSVSGNMMSVKLIEESANIRVTIGYTDGTESAADGSKAIATETGTEILVPNDATKEIQKIMIQVVEMGSVTLQSITGIDYSVTELEEGETRLLWKNSQGVELHWNNICEQDTVYGALLKEDQQLCITITSRDEDNEWPKVFIRDINNQEVGETLELNSLKQFPNVVRLTLTEEMVSRMADGFSICGDGITVNRVELYQPYAPQAGDINLKELNGGWNATYDAASHTITTTARWAARGWDIGDSRYNSYDLIQVKFLAVDFPVTLKMEYRDANGNKQATSTGVSAGNTTLQMPIPENIQQIDKVYLIWQQPASLTLTAAEVLSESDWNYPELMSVSTDIRYITHEGESEKWYDLNGRRVEQPSKGVFIKNGKKTVISK